MFLNLEDVENSNLGLMYVFIVIIGLTLHVLGGF